MDILAEKGFVPVIPPVLVREEAMYGTGFLPTDAVNIYQTAEDDLYLVGTAEVPLAALHMGEILDERAAARCGTRGTPPVSGARRAPTARTWAGCSASISSTRWRCSRSSTPESSWDEHEFLVSVEEEILGKLEIPYRVVNVAAGDLGARGREEVRHRGLAPRPGAVPRAHELFEHDRLPGAAVCRPVCVAPTAGPRSCTR